MSNCACETLWLYNPLELLRPNLLVKDICDSNNINAFSRALLLGALLSLLLAPMIGWAGFGMVMLVLFFLYGRWLFGFAYTPMRTVYVEGNPPVPTKEGFEGANIRPDLKAELAFPNAPTRIMTSPGATDVTEPTARNPFMNVLLDELKYNPTRPSADFASNPNNQVILDDYFRTQWYSDPTDVFGRSQSQRQFYTTPSTSIPNDQGSFQNWLYLIPGKTCKEGGRDACYPGTNGAPVTWLSQPN
jgi:hypothetical protein